MGGTDGYFVINNHNRNPPDPDLLSVCSSRVAETGPAFTEHPGRSSRVVSRLPPTSLLTKFPIRRESAGDQALTGHRTLHAQARYQVIRSVSMLWARSFIFAFFLLTDRRQHTVCAFDFPDKDG